MQALQRMSYFVLVFLLVPGAARADTVTIVPNRDNTIYQSNPANSNGAGQAIFVGTTGRDFPCRGLIGFDIASNVPAGATIIGVQLNLALANTQNSESPGSSRRVELHRLLADWGEGTSGEGSGISQIGIGFLSTSNGTAATWSHAYYRGVPWSNAGGDFMATASASANIGTTLMKYTWSSTTGLVSDVQSWLDNPASNFGWLLLGDESTQSTGRIFYSREASSPPALVVTYTPPAAGPARLVVSAPGAVTAGAAFDLTVTAFDTGGNIATGYTGTVNFSSTDAFPAVLPAAYTFTAGDNGTHTFSALSQLFTAGAQTLTAQDGVNGSIMGAAAISVVAAPADHLLIAAPASVVSGVPFDVMITALDPYNNVDTNYTGTVTWASGDSDPGVVLPADYPFVASDNGSHTFSAGITLITLGDQLLAAADTVSGILGAATVTVGPGP